MKHKKNILTLIIFIAVGIGVFAFREQIAKSATYGWLQASWSGGADTGAVANHTDNKTGWTKFFSKDANVVTDNDQLTLSSGSSSVTDTTTTQFNAGTKTSGGTAFVDVTNEELKMFLCGTNSVTYSGTVYPTVLIGTQCWMTKNLNVGTRINGAGNQTNNATLEKYCYADNEANCTTYGGLYQWNEAMQYVTTAGAQGICPTGWHIPTDAEQYTLENYLKDSGQTCSATRVNAWDCSTAGTKLKSGGSSGFNGLLAGYRYAGGSFANLSTGAFFWSSSVSGSNAWVRGLSSAFATVFRDEYDQAYGFSVRCLKD